MPATFDTDWPRRVTVLGVGLLGGSVALAIRRRRPNATLIGTARSEQKCDQLVAAAIVDQATMCVETACHQSDVVVVAAPVDRIASLVIEAAEASPRDCVITDVGSTKQQIVDEVAGRPGVASKFVAAHPIAGSEKSGFQHAKADLFDGRAVILTPTAQNDFAAIEKVNRFWQLVGGEIHTMSAADHDTHLAAISHVPHLVSALIAHLATDQSRSLAGSGWDDMTRVAAGDPTIWTAICRQNRQAILTELRRLADQLEQLRQTLSQTSDQADQAIHTWLAEAKRIKENS